MKGQYKPNQAKGKNIFRRISTFFSCLFESFVSGGSILKRLHRQSQFKRPF